MKFLCLYCKVSKTGLAIDKLPLKILSKLSNLITDTDNTDYVKHKVTRHRNIK